MPDYQTLSTIHDLVAEDGRDIIYQEARMTSKLVDVGLPGEEKGQGGTEGKRPIKVKKKPTMVGTVQTKKGGIRAFGVTADGATRRQGSAVALAKGKYDPKIIEGELEIPLGVANVAAGGDGIDYVDEQLRTMGSQYGMHLDRAVAGAQLAFPTGGGAIAATTFTTADPSGYLEGESYDRYTTGDVYVDTFRVTNIAPPSASLTGDWTITVETAFAVAIATTNKIYQSGAGTSSNRLTSLQDVCTAATTLYGLTTSQFPSGLSIALSSWDNISGRRMGDLIAVQSGERPTVIATNSLGLSKIVNASTALRRFNSGNMDQYGGLVAKFDDMDIVACEQVSGTRMIFINPKHCHLHEFWAFAFQGDGVGKGGFGAASLKLSENNISYKGLGTSGVEFVCDKRRAFGEFTGVGES